MQKGDKVLCKKNLNNSRYYFEKNEYYIIEKIDYEFGIVTLKGFDFYLVDGNTFFFEEYFNAVKDIRRMKLQNIKDKLRYEG